MSATSITTPIREVFVGAVPQFTGFFFAFRICLTLLLFRHEPALGTAVLNSCSVLLLYLVWTVTPATPNIPKLSMLEKWVFGYLTLIGLSLLWSVTRSPAIALTYWLAIACDCAAVYLLVRAGDSIAICQAFMRGFVFGAAAVSAIAWLLPTMPDLRIGDEEFLHPNAIGYIVALATLFALNLSRHSRLMTILAIACGGTLIRSLSKASIAASIAALTFYLLRDSHWNRKAKITIGLVTAVLIAASWGWVEAYADLYSRDYRVETLTGRTVLWTLAWEESLTAPWIGHGFYAFRTVFPLVGDFQPWHAHNEFLQQFFSYGILGVLSLAGLYWGLVRTIRKYASSTFASLAGAVLVFALVRGLVDTENLSVNYPMWLLILFSAVLPKSLVVAR